MLLLDPKAPGPLLRRRLRVGNRRRGKGGGVVREVAVAAPLYAGGAGVSLLCRAVSRRLVRAYGPRPVRKASRSTWEARARAPGLGGELSAELRRSCSAARRRDCPYRRTPARGHGPVRARHRVGTSKRLCP